MESPHKHALDHLVQRGVPINYSGDIGRMSQEVADMSERLAGIEQSPIPKQGPEHYAWVLERGRRGACSYRGTSVPE
ncbi:DUF6118 family protein [Rhizobium soli]|uniref:DUF6118 family protein n=1 Tax=Rhizobium soli TaxID=424798 RepID=UPI003CCD500C